MTSKVVEEAVLDDESLGKSALGAEDADFQLIAIDKPQESTQSKRADRVGRKEGGKRSANLGESVRLPASILSEVN